MNIGQWLLLEERLRKAGDIETLQVVLVNLLQHVFPYQQAILFKHSQNAYSTRMASNISEIDDQAQTVVWLNSSFYPWLTKHSQDACYFALNEITIPVEEHYQSAIGGIYLPLKSKALGEFGLVCWVNEKPSDDLLEFAPLMISTIVHAWEKLLNERRFYHKTTFNKEHLKMGAGVTLFLVFCLFFLKVTQSTIAPAEVSPEQPLLISPSLNGSISHIEVIPNQAVNSGQLLFELDDISIRNKLEEAEQNFNVANQRYLKAYRHAFSDSSSLHDIKILEEEKQQAKVTYEYQKSLLSRTKIKAPEAGVILYSDPKDWIGKPVNIGEKVMLLANPIEKEITFWIPIDNMITLDKDKDVRFFSNEDPTNTVYAKLEYFNPIAEARPDGTLAYFGVAKLKDKDDLRLGEKGVLKLYGTKVSIAHYVFRRPLRYLRQHLGI